jgi:hypothetical protein
MSPIKIYACTCGYTAFSVERYRDHVEVCAHNGKSFIDRYRAKEIQLHKEQIAQTYRTPSWKR